MAENRFDSRLLFFVAGLVVLAAVGVGAAAGAPDAGTESTPATSALDNETAPGAAPNTNSTTNATDHFSPAALDGESLYESQLFTVSDIVTFGYADNADVTTPTGDYNLDRGEARVDTVSRGVYQIAGNAPYANLWGDPVSSRVVGFFGMAGDGSAIDTEIHTYIPQSFDEREQFTVFAYENQTSLTISGSETGEVFWEGTLDEGEYATLEDASLPHDTFVTVESTNPVSAQTYFDQGFYVPSESDRWSGKHFYTYIDNVGDWTNDLIVNSFSDDTDVTIRNLETDEVIWDGTLDAAEAHNQAFTEGTYVEVETDKSVTVGVRPWQSWDATGRYNQGSSVPSKSGSKIGSDFMIPTLGPDYAYVFAYEDNTEVTVIDADTGSVSNTYTLDAGEYVNVDPGAGLWRVITNNGVSVQAGYGQASASFAPVEFGETESAIIQGTVLDSDGQPVTNASVKVYEALNWHEILDVGSLLSDLEPVAEVQTDSDGTYQTGDLGSGRYVVMAEDGTQNRGLSTPVSVPTTTEPVTVDVTLRGDFYPITQQLSEVDDASKAAIDENTEAAAEVYTEGYDTFVDPSFAESLVPTDLHDGIDLTITAIDTSLAYADPTTVVRNELKKMVAEELAWNLAGHGLHYSITEQFVSLDEDRRRTLKASAESIADETWLQSYDHASSTQEAISEGYTTTDVYTTAMDRLDETDDEYETFRDGLTDEDIDENFSVSETTAVLNQQEDWLRGEGPIDGIVITPQGNVYMPKQSQVHKSDFEHAKRQAERAEIGATVMDGVETTGTAAVIFGDPSTKAVGAVVQGVGTAGSIAFSTYGLIAENRMGKQWSNTQIYWADDTATIPEIKNESVQWLKEEVENPTLTDAETDVDVEIDSFLEIDGTPVVPANRPEYPWYITGPQFKAVSNATVTVENTGDLATADTRVLLTDHYTNDKGESVVSDMSMIHPGPGEEPMDLSKDSERSVELPFATNFSPLNPLKTHSLTADVWVEGKLGASETALYHVRPGLDFDLPELASFSTADAETVKQQSLLRSDAYAYTTDEADSDVSITQSTFDDQLSNVSTVLDTDLDSTSTTANTSFTPSAGVQEITFLMVAESGSGVNLNAYDESNRHVGFDLSTGETEVQIPDASYTGQDSKIQRITIEEPAQETFDIETRMTELATNTSKSVDVYAISTPERPPIIASSPADIGITASPGETNTNSFELAEIGGHESATGLYATAGSFETSSGVQLPDSVDISVSQPAAEIAPGENMSVNVEVDVPADVTLPDAPETRYTGNVTIVTDNAGTLNLTLSALLLNTSDPSLSIENAEGTVEGVNVDHPDDRTVNETDLPTLGVVTSGYDSEIVGEGNLSLSFADRSAAQAKAVYGVLENGSWVELSVTVNGQSVTATTGESDVNSTDLTEIVVANDYTNSDDIVSTDRLRVAINDWREQNAETDTLRDVIDAWRNGDPVQ